MIGNVTRKIRKYSFLFFFFLVFADQLSKYIIRASGGFFVCNDGIAFGIRINSVFFYVLWISIIAFIFLLANAKFESSGLKKLRDLTFFKSRRFWIFNFKAFPPKTDAPRAENLFRVLGYALILSGAASNVIDRLIFGCVIDFINLNFWPVFNLADIFIAIGAIISIINIFKKKSVC